MLVKKIHYGWIVIAITCPVLLTSAAIKATPGVLMVPLEHEFHWTRATIALAVSINLVLYGCIAPFAAAVMERFGIRRSILCALTLVGVGVASTSLMKYQWQLILMWGVLVGAGAGFLASVLAATIATRWFTERRGMVTGILSGASSTGQLLFLPILANVTVAYGWRTTVIVITAVVCVVLPIVALLMRDRPSDVGLMPYGETGEPEQRDAPSGNPIALAFDALRRASQIRDFWIIAGTYFICGASTSGLVATHMIAACVDHGYSEITGATLLSTMGVFNLIGTTNAGWLSDKIANNKLLSVYYAFRGLSLLCLPFAFVNIYTMASFAVLYGLCWFAAVSPTVKLIGATVGRERAGMVYGWAFIGHQVGAGLAAVVGGLLREQYGSYTEAFMLSGALCLVAAVAALFIGAGQKKPAMVLATA